MASFQQAIQGKTREGGWDGHDNATLLLQDSQAEAIDAMFLALSKLYAAECPSPSKNKIPRWISSQSVPSSRHGYEE